MTKRPNSKRILPGLPLFPGTPVWTAKKSGNVSRRPSSFRNAREFPLQKEMPTRQSPRKRRGGCKAGMLSSNHFLALGRERERKRERERERERERVRLKGIYATCNRASMPH